MNKDTIKTISLFAGGVVVGAGATYLLTNSAIKAKYVAIADEEIASVKDTYKLLRKEPPYDNPETAVTAYKERLAKPEVEDYTDRIDKLGYASSTGDLSALDDEDDYLASKTQMETVEGISSGDEMVDVVTKNNIWTSEKIELPDSEIDVTEWDRNQDVYVITTMEFMEDEQIDGIEYDKQTIAWYPEDLTLLDDNNNVITDEDDVVRHENLMNHFGKGSEDSNILYVRNELLHTDFEITREKGSYVSRILGVDFDHEEISESMPKKKRPKEDD